MAWCVAVLAIIAASVVAGVTESAQLVPGTPQVVIAVRPSRWWRLVRRISHVLQPAERAVGERATLPRMRHILRRARFVGVAACAIAVAASAQAAAATVGPIQFTVPDGFNLRSGHHDGAEISAWTKSTGSSKTLLQVTLYDMGAAANTSTPQELSHAARGIPAPVPGGSRAAAHRLQRVPRPGTETRQRARGQRHVDGQDRRRRGGGCHVLCDRTEALRRCVSNSRCVQPSWCCSGSSMHIAAVAWLNCANGCRSARASAAWHQTGGLRVSSTPLTSASSSRDCESANDQRTHDERDDGEQRADGEGDEHDLVRPSRPLRGRMKNTDRHARLASSPAIPMSVVTMRISRTS